MDQKQTIEFLKQVHIGDLVKLEVERGILKGRVDAEVGYVSQLNPIRVCLQPQKNPIETNHFWERNQIEYGSVKSYEIVRSIRTINDPETIPWAEQARRYIAEERRELEE